MCQEASGDIAEYQQIEGFVSHHQKDIFFVFSSRIRGDAELLFGFSRAHKKSHDASERNRFRVFA